MRSDGSLAVGLCIRLDALHPHNDVINLQSCSQPGRRGNNKSRKRLHKEVTFEKQDKQQVRAHAGAIGKHFHVFLCSKHRPEDKSSQQVPVWVLIYEAQMGVGYWWPSLLCSSEEKCLPPCYSESDPLQVCCLHFEYSRRSFGIPHSRCPSGTGCSLCVFPGAALSMRTSAVLLLLSVILSAAQAHRAGRDDGNKGEHQK